MKNGRQVDVILCPDGPLLIRGDLGVKTPDGQVHRTERPVSAVCRCGKSASLPWCDGTHQVIRNRDDEGDSHD